MQLFWKSFEVSLANKVFASPIQTLFALKVQNWLTSTADANWYHLTALQGGGVCKKNQSHCTWQGQRAGFGLWCQKKEEEEEVMARVIFHVVRKRNVDMSVYKLENGGPQIYSAQ